MISEADGTQENDLFSVHIVVQEQPLKGPSDASSVRASLRRSFSVGLFPPEAVVFRSKMLAQRLVKPCVSGLRHVSGRGQLLFAATAR